MLFSNLALSSSHDTPILSQNLIFHLLNLSLAIRKKNDREREVVFERVLYPETTVDDECAVDETSFDEMASRSRVPRAGL